MAVGRRFLKDLRHEPGDAATLGRALEDILRAGGLRLQPERPVFLCSNRPYVTNEISRHLHRIMEVVQKSSGRAKRTATSAGQLAGMA